MPGVLYPDRPDYGRLMRPSQFIHPDSYRPPNGHSRGADRPRRGIGTVEMPAKADVSDGDRVTINDGVDTVIYEMDTLGNGCTWPGSICVDLSTAVSANDCRMALQAAIEANSHVTIVSAVGGLLKMQTVVYKKGGGIGTTGANILCEGFYGGSLGNDVIPIRWGLSRGVLTGGSLNC
jgi:hypothetical protein